MKTTRQKVACCASALLFSAITFASGAAASAPEVLPTTVQVGDVRVGFTIETGEWKPAKLACATKRVPFLETSSYKRPHQSKECVQPALPCVFHSEWRAPDGRKAAVLVNWTREEQKYELDFDGVRKSDVLPPLSWKAERL